MKNEALFLRLKAENRLNQIPSHEIEEMLGIRLDDFDTRKRRYGYPESFYYRSFSCEEAGKEKFLTDRLLKSDLKEPRSLLYLSIPKEHLRLMAICFIIGIISAIAWATSLFYGFSEGAYFGFPISFAAFAAIWIIRRHQFYGFDPRKYFEDRRKEDFFDSPVAESYS